MSIALLVITDGRRDCLRQTLERFDGTVNGPITSRIIHDDSGDPAYQTWLADTYPRYRIISTPGRSGFGGAIRSAWRNLPTVLGDEQFVFHLEDDFMIQRCVNLSRLAQLLVDEPHLAQVALRRQPWGDEPRPGGFMAQYPDWYVDRTDGSREWVETTRNWTTNPCLYRRELCAGGWPEDPHSEGRYGFVLREQGLPWGVAGEDVRFGYWGSKASGEWAHHIGRERVGTGY